MHGSLIQNYGRGHLLESIDEDCYRKMIITLLASLMETATFIFCAIKSIHSWI